MRHMLHVDLDHKGQSNLSIVLIPMQNNILRQISTSRSFISHGPEINSPVPVKSRQIPIPNVDSSVIYRWK